MSFFLCLGSTSTALTYTRTVFYNAHAFNADISKWDTAQVTTMENSTSNFTSLSSCSIACSMRACGSLTILGFLFFLCLDSTSTAYSYTVFYYATAFNADISKWNTARVTDMSKSTSNVHQFVCLFNCLFLVELVIL